MSSIIEKAPEDDKLTVYYDGARPICIRDRKTYKKLSGSSADQVCWFDIHQTVIGKTVSWASQPPFRLEGGINVFAYWKLKLSITNAFF